MTPHINSTAGLTLGSLCHHMTIATFAIFKLTVYVEDYFFCRHMTMAIFAIFVLTVCM